MRSVFISTSRKKMDPRAGPNMQQRVQCQPPARHAKHCGRTDEEVEAALERDRYMAPEEAKAWGLVDHVYSDRSQLELPGPAIEQ